MLGCSAVRAVDCMYASTMYVRALRATGAPRWEWIAIKAGPKQSCTADRDGQERPPTRKERPGRPHLATLIPALHPRPKQALPEPPRHCTSWPGVLDTGYRSFTRLSRCRAGHDSSGWPSCWPAPSHLLPSCEWGPPAHLIPAAIMSPSLLKAATVLCHGVNLLWPKASAPTRGSWACSPTMALCRGALLRAWHMIATWTVPARFFFQNPRPKEADSLR